MRESWVRATTCCMINSAALQRSLSRGRLHIEIRIISNILAGGAWPRRGAMLRVKVHRHTGITKDCLRLGIYIREGKASKPLPAAGAQRGQEHAPRLDGAAKVALEHARGELGVAAGGEVSDVGGGLEHSMSSHRAPPCAAARRAQGGPTESYQQVVITRFSEFSSPWSR